LAKAKPGQLNYATGGVGSSNHLAAELFKSMAGVDITTIQYRGSGGGVIGLMGGEVQMMITSTGSVTPHIKSGRVRALAVTSAEPSALVPGLPTVSASGVPGYESTQKAGLFAPAKTPAAIITRLNREVVALLQRPDMKEKFFGDGVETVGTSPQELGAMVKSEIARIGKIVKDLGITSDE
jgi:tripartite-type tricarboxylate transporter receptor subunit TctC